jgi:hypothetical protein
MSSREVNKSEHEQKDDLGRTRSSKISEVCSCAAAGFLKFAQQQDH